VKASPLVSLEISVMNQNDLDGEVLAAALRYAAAGLMVFPCVYGTKEPAVRRGF
jgi:hypothetical protein